MITGSSGLNGSMFNNPQVSVAGVTREAPAFLSPTGTRQESARALGVPSFQRPQVSRGARGEQILEVVVAAVTVVADILTLALSRSSQKERPQARKPIPPPSVGQNPGAGTSGAVSQIPPSYPSTPAGSHKRLEAIRSDAGEITVRTFDGYVVRTDAGKGGWSITAPDGKTTRVEDGTRVRESDGGYWSVHGRSSFMFGAQKLTLQTAVAKNGTTLPNSLTIYSGSERVTIGGLATGFPTLDAVAGDALSHDDALHDGATYYRAQTKLGESWSVGSKGGRRVMGAR
jgi:hypothetical protein